MKKVYLTVVLTLTCLFGLGISAHAQDASRVVFNVPFDFVVDGSRIMPAGTYSINRNSQDPRSGLVIRGENNSTLLLPVAVGGASAEQAKLSFEHAGNTNFLSKVETPAGVYTIETPRAISKLAQRRDHSAMSSSGN